MSSWCWCGEEGAKGAKIGVVRGNGKGKGKGKEGECVLVVTSNL